MRLRKFRKLFVVGGLAVVIAGGSVAWLAARPKYNDKTLFDLASSTVASTNALRIRGISDAEARDALATLRGMGPELDRFLIKELQTQDGFWRSNYQSFCGSAIAQPFRRHLPSALPASVRRGLAVRIIGKTGRMSPAIERALGAACQDSVLFVRANAAMILAYRGSSSAEVTSAWRQAMQNQMVAGIVELGPRHAVIQFDLIGKNVDEIIADLERPLPAALRDAAIALRDLGSNAAPAVPALVRTLNETNETIRMACVEALGAIGPAASGALPTLRKLRREEDGALVDHGGSVSNQQFLEKLRLDSNRIVARSTIVEAIRQIESPTEQ